MHFPEPIGSHSSLNSANQLIGAACNLNRNYCVPLTEFLNANHLRAVRFNPIISAG